MDKINIAIVEDEGIVAMDIRKSLQSFGYNVVFVSDSGEKALNKLNEHKADLVLMDVVLKGRMDGIEAAKIIVNDMHIPVIFLTAFEDNNTKERAKDFKSFGYLIKPFEDSHLKAIVENALVSSGYSI